MPGTESGSFCSSTVLGGAANFPIIATPSIYVLNIGNFLMDITGYYFLMDQAAITPLISGLSTQICSPGSDQAMNYTCHPRTWDW